MCVQNIAVGHRGECCPKGEGREALGNRAGSTQVRPREHQSGELLEGMGWPTMLDLHG